jgi:hypothetical protein
MRICHVESDIFYDITEDKERYKLHDSHTSHTYHFKEAYEAIWMAVELTRNMSFDMLTNDALSSIVKRSSSQLNTAPKAMIAMLKKEKINRTYYDQVFLKLLSQFRSGQQTFIISNKTNFSVEHEVAFLVRKMSGVSLSIPAIRVTT